MKPKYRRISVRQVPPSVLDMYDEDEWHAVPIGMGPKRYVVHDAESGIAYEFAPLKPKRKGLQLRWLVADANAAGTAR